MTTLTDVDGLAEVALPDDVMGAGEVMLSLPEHDVQERFSPAVKNFVVPMRPAPVAALTESPQPWSTQTRVTAGDVAASLERVGGVPPVDAIPVNEVALHFPSRFLDPHGPLVLGQWSTGTAIEFDTTWEPVGWALDEWTETTVLAPFEDMVVASATVAADDGREQRSADTDSTAQTTTERSEADHRESMSGRQTGSASTFGVQAGLGGGKGDAKASPVGTLAAVLNPVAALVHALDGVVQLGASTTVGQVDVSVLADLQRSLNASMVQHVEWSRSTNDVAQVTTRNELQDERVMRTLRNMTPGHTLNLASFTICRQWRARTVELQRRPVAFAPITKVKVPFEPQEIVDHREVLLAALQDQRLRGDIEAVASRTYPAPDGLRVRRVTGTVAFSDGLEGRNSALSVTVAFRPESSADSGHHSALVHDTDVGPARKFSIVGMDRPLSHLEWVTLSAENPHHDFDHTAVVSELTLCAELADGSTVDLCTTWTGELRAGPEVEVPLLPRPARTSTSVTAPLDATAQRVLQHLNQNIAYYRLAIDLALDPVTRFVRLSEEHGAEAARLANLVPLGVAGAHLAFSVDGKAHVGQMTPIDQLYTTPTTATYAEVLLGKNDVPGTAATAPTVPLSTDKSVAWPTPLQMAPLPTVERPGPAETTQAASPPADPGSALTDLTSALKDFVVQVKDVLGAKPTDPSAAPATSSPATSSTPSGPASTSATSSKPPST